jgi:alpha-tubulin suppressor-like RCC1 family protein
MTMDLSPDKLVNRFNVSMSMAETILLSSAGDVIVTRCRDTSPYPDETLTRKVEATADHWYSDRMVTCCDEDFAFQMQQSSLCSPWCRDPVATKSNIASPRQGLLGGSPTEVAPSWMASTPSSLRHQAHPATSNQFSSESNHATLDASASLHSAKHDSEIASQQSTIINFPTDVSDERSIVPIRSFDFSHFRDGGNDMISDDDTDRVRTLRVDAATDIRHQTFSGVVPPHSREAQVAAYRLFHGVPRFLHSLAQVRVKQVSAHPLGSHVLMISHAGLLYSYGLNNYGQLGIGTKSLASSSAGAYLMTPTIVTPLVENGGKSVLCAAGATHSLVVVQTEERRLVKSRSLDDQCSSSPRSRSSNESIAFHQVYGFGRNEHLQLGLMSLKQLHGVRHDSECVLLPRRVSLRCRIHCSSLEYNSNETHPMGIFALAASVNHSAAIMRRSNDSVELYTWGNTNCGANPTMTAASSNSGFESAHSATDFPTEGAYTQSRKVLPLPSIVPTLSRSAQKNVKTRSLLVEEDKECPTAVSLGVRSTFVITSLGRCFSFGSGFDGTLGLGPQLRESRQPTELKIPANAQGNRFLSVSAGASHVLACTEAGEVLAWGSRMPPFISPPSRSSETKTTLASSTLESNESTLWFPEKMHEFPAESASRNPRIVYACAGYDSSTFVAKTGEVYVSGKASGRLGLGEIKDDVFSPIPMFGGLRLFSRCRDQSSTCVSAGPPSPL